MTVYLDENATASPDLDVMKQVYLWLSEQPSNASSLHSLGRRARGAIEQSRRQLATALEVNPRHLTFTSGATESIHTLIEGLLNPGDHVLVSAVEHPAMWGALSKLDLDLEVIPVNRHGQIDPQDFAQAVRPQTRLAIMMAAQNEIGTLYPTQKIAQVLGHVPLLVDSVQAFGKVPLKLEETGASYAVLSGHKIGAPQGVGLIWCKGGSSFVPLLRGGAQERGRRAGTENIPAIIGFGLAAQNISKRLKQQENLLKLREYVREQLQSKFSDHYSVIGLFEAPLSVDQLWTQHGQLPNTLSIMAHQGEGDLLLQQLDLAGFCLSAGSACSSGALEPSPILKALGYSASEASRGLRLSMGMNTKKPMLDSFLQVLSSLV